MSHQSPFTWRHCEAEIILLCVRWYLRYALSYLCRLHRTSVHEKGPLRTIIRVVLQAESSAL
jgi:hypothetical protein